MKCPRVGCKNEAIIDKIYGVLPCEQCQKNDLAFKVTKGAEFDTLSQADRVQQCRDSGAKDMIQPFMSNKPNPEFAKAFPDRAPDYFTKEELEAL